MSNPTNKKRTIRSDGKEYPSAYEAAKAIVDEMGCGDVQTVYTGIRRVCRNVPHNVTAYGYGWRYEVSA